MPVKSNEKFTALGNTNMNNDNRYWGLVLVFIGVGILAFRFLDFDVMQHAWTFFIIAPGLFLLYNALNSEPIETDQFIGGATTTATGLLLLGMSLTGRWYAWSYAWAIYPVVTGAAMMYAARRNGNGKLEAQGRQTLRVGVVMLAIFGIFFEVFIFSNLVDSIDWTLLPLLLIGAGLFLLARSRNNGNGGDKPKNDDTPNTYEV